MTAIKLIFTKLMLTQQLFANSYTKYHENLTYNLANNTKSQMDVVSIQGTFLFSYNKHLRRKPY
jgi:hypothetical protein